jgi:hypothetical protein
LAFLSLLLAAANTAAPRKSISTEPDIFTKCWEYKVNPKLDVGLSVDASSVYFLDDENRLIGVDLAAGTKLWSSEIGGKVVSNLLVLEDSILFVTSSQLDASSPSSKATLRAISRRTGITDWSAEVVSSPLIWIGVVGGNVVAVGSDGLVSASANGGGKLTWQTDLKSRVTATPYFYKSGIEIATEKNEVLNVTGSDGQVRVDWKAKYLPTAVLLDPSGRLVVGDERGNFMSVSSGGDRIWGFRNGAQISSATLYGADYLAASYDNFLYKLSRSGDVKWKRRLSGRVNDGPFILGDTAVVSIVGTGSVYVLDLKKGKISNRIEVGDEVSLRVAAATNGSGFAVAGPVGISYFSSTKCPAK